MNIENFIPLDKLCTYYKVEMSLLSNLNEIGLIEIETIEQTQYIHQDRIQSVEKILRMHRELDVNIEGIDIIFNLLQKIDALEHELISVKNRLRLYEN